MRADSCQRPLLHPILLATPANDLNPQRPGAVESSRAGADGPCPARVFRDSERASRARIYAGHERHWTRCGGPPGSQLVICGMCPLCLISLLLRGAERETEPVEWRKLRASGGTADALASGASVRKGVGVQIPPRARNGKSPGLRTGALLRFRRIRSLPAKPFLQGPDQRTGLGPGRGPRLTRRACRSLEPAS